jgi:TolB-like protein
MKKYFYLIIAAIVSIFLTSCMTGGQEDSADEIAYVSEDIAWQLLDSDVYENNYHIAVLPFIESSKETPNDFGKYFADELISSLYIEGEGDLVILERTQVNQLLQEAEFAATGLISEDTAVKLGQMLGVDAVVIGSFIIIDNTVRINARAVSVETGRIDGVAKSDLPLSAYRAIMGESVDSKE